MQSQTEADITKEVRAYLRQIGIRPVSELDRAIEKEMGVQEGGKIIDKMEQLFGRRAQNFMTRAMTDPHALRETELVETLNQSRRLSMIAAGYYDWFVLRTALSCFCQYPDCFSGEVCDFGCGNGVATTFLARRFPEARFTGMDISARALAVAREIAEENQLENIHFVQQDALAQDTDTLLSVRTLHENTPVVSDIQSWQAAVHDYFSHWTAHVRPGGHLMLFERLAEKSGWQAVEEALSECGFTLRPGASEYVTCHSGDEMVKFRFALFDRGHA